MAPAAITSPPSWHLTASSPPSAGTLLLPTFVWVSPLSAGTLLLPTLIWVPEDLYGYLSGATHPLLIRYGGGLGFSPLLFCSARAGQRSFFSFSAARRRLLVARGSSFWAPCGARRLRLMGGMASELWSFLMLFLMLFCWFTVARGFLYVACLWRFLVRLYTVVVAFRDLFFHPVAVSVSGFSSSC